MAVYRVQGPDGKMHKFEGPDGATPQEVEAAAEQQFSAEPPAPVELTKVGAPTSIGGKGERFGRGLFEPVVGIGQLAAHGLAMLPSDTLKENARTYDDFAKQYQGDSAEMSPEGMDWSRIAGNATTLAPTMLAGGAPATLGGVARAGAVGGGLGGAATPTDGEGFGVTKTLQTGGGALAGAVLSPVAQKAIGALSKGGAYLVNQARRLGSNVTPQNIQILINQTLQQSGIDPSGLPQAFMDDVTKQVTSAMQSGGKMDAATLANRAAFEKVGAAPTQGQATQNPSQWGMEDYLRQAPGAEPLATQYQSVLQTLNQRLNDVAKGAAPAVKDVDAGRRLMGDLSQADARGKSVVDELYAQVRAHPDADLPVDFGTVAQSVSDQLYRGSLFEALPATLRKPIQEMAAGRGAARAGMQPTIRTADDINKTISNEIAKAQAKGDRSALEAISVYKRTLDEAVTDAAQGSTIARDLFTARGAASDRFGIHDAIPALRATINDAVAPDDFMRKFVYNANLDDFKKLSTFVQQASPNSWQQIRGQIIADLQGAASPGGDPLKFTQAGFNKALRSLDDSGKMETLFSKPEIEMLRSIGRVGELTQVAPAGVRTTGQSGVAKGAAMLATLAGKIPKFGAAGAFVQSMAQKGGNALQANVALSPAPVAQPPFNALLPQQLVNQLAASLGLAGGVTPNALAQTFYANGE